MSKSNVGKVKSQKEMSGWDIGKELSGNWCEAQWPPPITALHHFHKALQLMGWDLSGSYFVQPSGSSSSINIFQTDFEFFYTSRHHIYPLFYVDIKCAEKIALVLPTIAPSWLLLITFFFSLPHKLFTRRNLFQTNRFPRWVHTQTHTHALLMDAGYIIDMFGRQILRGWDLFVVQINARHSLFFFSRDPPIVRTFTHTHGKNRGAVHGACPFIFLLILQLEKKKREPAAEYRVASQSSIAVKEWLPTARLSSC